MTLLIILIISFILTIALVINIVTLVNKSSGPSPPSPPPGPSKENENWYNLFQIPGTDNIYGYNDKIQKFKNEKYGDFYDKLTNQFATALWLDTTENISKLNDAIKWMKNNNKTNIIIIVYNLPNRDCAATASNGHLCCVSGAEYPNWCNPTLQIDFGGKERSTLNADYGECIGLKDYKIYIDKIKEIIENKSNENINFTCIIEPDSMGNVITNSKNQYGNCSMNTAILSILPGIHYAINKLSAKNTKLYLDLAHPLWLGWDAINKQGVLHTLLLGSENDEWKQYTKSSNTIANNYLDYDFKYDTTTWLSKLTGFAINVSNYIPLGDKDDPLINIFQSGIIPDSIPDNTPCNNKDGNSVTNLRNYAALLKASFGNIREEFEILIDTGRNGRMDEQYKDNKTNYGIENPCGSWCNVFGQKGPTIGEPTFNKNGDWNIPDNQPYIKFMCLKPPGESDGCVKGKGTPPNPDSGSGSEKDCINTNSNDSCSRFDSMCGIQGTRGYNLGSSSLDDDFYKNLATCPPEAGQWDDIQIQQIANNYKPN